MRIRQIIFSIVCFAIITAVAARYYVNSQECKAKGGELMRGPISGYECVKAVRLNA